VSSAAVVHCAGVPATGVRAAWGCWLRRSRRRLRDGDAACRWLRALLVLRAGGVADSGCFRPTGGSLRQQRVRVSPLLPQQRVLCCARCRSLLTRRWGLVAGSAWVHHSDDCRSALFVTLAPHPPFALPLQAPGPRRAPPSPRRCRASARPPTCPPPQASPP